MATSKAREYDIVVFGASGFTGKEVVHHVAKIGSVKQKKLRWAIAGRSMTKLHELRESIGVGALPLIVADIDDPAKLKAMAASTYVVINCVGPFRFYGDAVVKACVEEGTDYVDICGEPMFMEQMVVKYDTQAVQSGALIVSACGFDCIPAELGLVHASSFFKDGPMTWLEMTHVISSRPGGGRTLGHYGTWESLVHGLATAGELTALRRAHPKPKLAIHGARLPARRMVSYDRNTDRWCIPFLGADASVVKRSQQTWAANNPAYVPVQFTAHASLKNLFWLIVTVVWAIVFYLLSRIAIGRKFLLKFPRAASLGVFSEEGPSAEKRANTNVTTTFIAHGYSHPLPADNARPPRPDVKVKTQITISDPGYTSTAIMVAQCAVTLLEERSKTPKGGVLTPGVVFRDTDLIKRLHSNGVRFSHVSTQTV